MGRSAAAAPFTVAVRILLLHSCLSADSLSARNTSLRLPPLCGGERTPANSHLQSFLSGEILASSGRTTKSQQGAVKAFCGLEVSSWVINSTLANEKQLDCGYFFSGAWTPFNPETVRLMIGIDTDFMNCSLQLVTKFRQRKGI